MRHFSLSVILTFIFGSTTLDASSVDNINLLMKDKKMSIYGVKSEDQKSNNGMGLFYNTQNLKVKVEGSDTAFKTGAIFTYHPFQTPGMYIDVGANYINANLQENDSINNNYEQYSSAFAIGYMLYNNLYVEIGENISTLNGYQMSKDDKASAHIRKDSYMQIGKRFETPIGTIDTHLNNSQIYNTLSKKEENYETSVHYYLDNAINIGYFYNTNQDETCTGYSMNLSYFTTQYTRNIAQDSYDVIVGIKANFTDITNFATYTAPKRSKKHLSKAHKFTNLVLHDNMRLRK